MTFSMLSKFRALASSAFFGEGADEAREGQKEHLAEFMRAAGRVYNQEHPDQAIRQVELYYVKTDRNQRAAKAFERRKLWDVSL